MGGDAIDGSRNAVARPKKSTNGRRTGTSRKAGAVRAESRSGRGKEFRIAVSSEDAGDAELRAAIVFLKRHVPGLLSALEVRRAEVEIWVTGEVTMAALHARTTGDWSATDVLTFDYGSSAEQGIVSAQIAVCWDVAVKTAAEREHAPAEELLLYVLHGILHCLGHDDSRRADFARMHAREDEVLSSLGFGALFTGNGKTKARKGRARA